MYTSYFYNSGASAADILSDIAALLTGETDKNKLSASCNKTLTEIDASVDAAGWSMWDVAAGTNAVVLRAAVADNPSQYKYLWLSTNTAGYLVAAPYGDWDTAAHSGSDMSYAATSTSHAQRLNVSLGGRLDIRAKNGIYWGFSFQNGVYGSATGSWPSGLLERTRLSPWDTVENGYPPFLFVSGLNQSTYSEPRSVNAAGADVTGLAASCFPMHAFGGGGTLPTLPITTVPSNSSKDLKHILAPFGTTRVADGHLGGDFSSLADIWLTTYGNGSSFDTMNVDGKIYVIWAVTTTWRFAVRKG